MFKSLIAAASLSLLALAPAAQAQGPGRDAPPFTLTDVSGKRVDLADLRGQDRGARVDQPGLPVRAEALRQRQHAGAAEALHRPGRRVGHDQLARRRATPST